MEVERLINANWVRGTVTGYSRLRIRVRDHDSKYDGNARQEKMLRPFVSGRPVPKVIT